MNLGVWKSGFVMVMEVTEEVIHDHVHAEAHRSVERSATALRRSRVTLSHRDLTANPYSLPDIRSAGKALHTPANVSRLLWVIRITQTM